VKKLIYYFILLIISIIMACSGGNPVDPQLNLTGKIAFWSNRDTNFQVYIMNADRSDQINLSNNNNYELQPDISPDGLKIIFSRSTDLQTGKFDIFVMDIDGSNERNLTNHDHEDAFPRWSPDESYIVFVKYIEIESNPMPPKQIFIMKADGTSPTNMSNNNYEYLDTGPSWSVE